MTLHFFGRNEETLSMECLEFSVTSLRTKASFCFHAWSAKGVLERKSSLIIFPIDFSQLNTIGSFTWSVFKASFPSKSNQFFIPFSGIRKKKSHRKTVEKSRDIKQKIHSPWKSSWKAIRVKFNKQEISSRQSPPQDIREFSCFFLVKKFKLNSFFRILLARNFCVFHKTKRCL